MISVQSARGENKPVVVRRFLSACKKLITVRRGWKALYIDNKILHCMFELSVIDFRFYFLPLIIPDKYGGRCRHLFGFTFHHWNNPKKIHGAMPKKAYLSISLLYLRSLDFRIGDGNTWLWIRNENLYAYKVHRRNRKLRF